MNTSFNDNQHLPKTGLDSEAVQRLHCLEQRLEESEARTYSLLATLPQIVWFACINGSITHFNQRWYEYTGLTPAKSLGWKFLQAVHPEDRNCIVVNSTSSKKLQSSSIECRILGADGTYRWFIGKTMPVLGADGQLLEWAGTYTLKGQTEQDSVASCREIEQDYSDHITPSKLQIKLTPGLANNNHSLKLGKQAERHSTEPASQHLRRFINELSRAIVWEADVTTGQFTFVSHSAERILGYPVKRWLSEPNFWANLIHPEDRQWTVALCRRQLSQNRDYELEYRCLAADKRVVWLRDRAHVVRDHQGQVQKRRGLMVDITLAKLAQAELQARIYQQAAVAQLSQAALQGTEVSTLLDQGVLLIAQTLAVEYCQVLELLPEGNALQLRAGVGWQDEWVGQAIIEANTDTETGYTLHSRQPVVVEDLRYETRFQGSSLLHDHKIVSSISVIIDAAPNKAYLEEGEATSTYPPFGILGAHSSRRRTFSRSDVDFLQSIANVLAVAIRSQQVDESLYETRSQLAQTTAVLEKRNSELDQFVYVASHDLKAPLRAIANLSQWIEEDICDLLDTENQQQMQLLRGRVQRLESLIEGLLQYSRAGRRKTKPEPIDVEALLRQVIESLTPPHQFTINIAPGMPTLVTERLSLEHVFTQLISNAIKHHPSREGTVNISVEEQADAYEFAVADDGAGIAPRFHEKVFVIFQTLQARDTVENTGVGLAIAKRIVESQGGTIRLESQEGQGATFYFTWPKLLSETGS